MQLLESRSTKTGLSQRLCYVLVFMVAASFPGEVVAVVVMIVLTVCPLMSVNSLVSAGLTFLL